MLLAEINPAAAVKSLASNLCPACSGKKHSRHTFCGRCYSSLSFGLQRALYKSVGFGYEEAIVSAMKAMGRTDFVLPPSAPPRLRTPRAQGALFDTEQFTRGGMPS